MLCSHTALLHTAQHRTAPQPFPHTFSVRLCRHCNQALLLLLLLLLLLPPPPPAPAPSPATKSSAASLPPPHSQTGRYRPPANAASMFRHTETAGQPLRSSCDEPEVSIPSGPGAADATVEVAADAAAAAAVAAELPGQLGVKAAAEGLRRICWPSRVPGGPAGMGSAKASTDRMAAGVWWAHKCWWWVGLSMGGGHPGAHCCQHCMACH